MYTVNETSHEKLNQWILENAELCKPDNIVWCDGSKEEYDRMMAIMVESKLAVKLDEKKHPNSYVVRTDPSDVARVEDRTFIASKKKEDAGSTNNWTDPEELKTKMRGLYKGSMNGRTMYVIPFSMGPIDSPMAKMGIQITDSPYVVANMHTMARVSPEVLKKLDKDGEFIPCLHSIGKPLGKGESDNGVWPCAPIKDKHIAHFTDENLIWSYGSGYGGNALLGKKCLALRIASNMGRHEGWMAEHMLIIRLTNPEGKVYHAAAAFPSACGKTNMAMLQSTLLSWKIECVGDDIAWMKKGKDGRLYAINPENGFFGVAPGTSYKTNPMMMKTLEQGNIIYTNVVETDDGSVWWEGMGTECPGGIDWKGNRWTPESDVPGAHPNSRFTAPASQCPVFLPDCVPIDFFIFGGRRSEVMPLVHEAKDWDHGVFMGASVASEPTAAALDVTGLRYDPMAMKPFIGYNVGDYWKHWFEMGDTLGDKAPKAFYVNWFQKEGKAFLWPGFGENSRVLKWMCERVEGKANAVSTPLGLMPRPEDLDLSGLDILEANMSKLLKVDSIAFEKELDQLKTFMKKAEDRLPERMQKQLDNFCERITKAAKAQRFEASSSSLKSSSLLMPPRDLVHQGKGASMPAPELN